ncbi:MAG TPA: hypothetical protein VF837_02635 [Patescibacteria group bacterium]
MSNVLNLIVPKVFASDFVGNINLPAGIPTQVPQVGSFISTIVRFIIIVAGLFTLWQFLSGGLGMITGGSDKGKVAEAQNKITMAITGLAIIAASFLIIGIVSQLLFGSFTAILIPQLQSVTP